VIRVYDEAGSVIETREHAGGFKVVKRIRVAIFLVTVFVARSGTRRLRKLFDGTVSHRLHLPYLLFLPAGYATLRDNRERWSREQNGYSARALKLERN
jgi:hypothetical protein